MVNSKKCFFQSPNAIFDNVGLGLTTYEKLVYLYLCRCGNQGADAFPSYERIAKKCSISRRTATKVIRSLEEKGRISVKRRPKSNHDNDSNLYIVNALPSVSETLDLVSVGDQPSVVETPYKEPFIKNPVNKNHLKGSFGNELSHLNRVSTLEGDTPSITPPPRNGKNNGNDPTLQQNELSTSPFPETISFYDFLERYPGKYDSEEKAIEVVDYFLSTYEHERGEKHPNLTEKTWGNILDNLFTFVHGERSVKPGDVGELDADALQEMIDHYFKTKYDDGCDYHLPHFASDGVKHILFYAHCYFL